ncbi:MAG: hypothetical protein KGV56_02855 [Gammaproteobacteria bacterium]|nr:hypothetical protein [Gammaproteobacteria bacterium]
MKILQSKILLAILACLIVLVGIGGYFYKENLAEKQRQAEAKKYFTEEIDDETKAVMKKNQKLIEKAFKEFDEK